MPRFFFDVLDSRSGFVPDDEGTECADAVAAKQDAQRAIGEMIKDAMPDGDEYVIVMRIRDESGKALVMVSTVMRAMRVD
jgi:hypothetical protein